MTSCTLVLNADFNPLGVAPLSTINWKEAVKLMWLEQVDVLEYYKDWYVHSPSMTLQVPSVVVSRTYVKSSRSVKFNKNNLCIRDEHTCQYCLNPYGKSQLTMDHVLPRSKGGKTTWNNIVMACTRCNTLKGNKDKMKPAKEPQRPSMGEIVGKARRSAIAIPNENWIPYIGWNPKLITVTSPSHNIDDLGV
jgi:5-methylcytosine-specific restriction endonuclease McrA